MAKMEATITCNVILNGFVKSIDCAWCNLILPPCICVKEDFIFHDGSSMLLFPMHSK